MFWLDLLITFIFMILMMIVRFIFKMNKTLGRIEEQQRFIQSRLKVLEEHEVHIRKEE